MTKTQGCTSSSYKDLMTNKWYGATSNDATPTVLVLLSAKLAYCSMSSILKLTRKVGLAGKLENKQH